MLCLVKDAAHCISDFLRYYSRLGVGHIVILDNGSSDRTLEILRQAGAVTLLETKLPYERYNILLKRFLVETYGAGRWSLCVDVDEYFDYPYSDRVSLSSLVAYLNRHGYTAVVAQMLDMFSAYPVSSFSKRACECRYYDISAVQKKDYAEFLKTSVDFLRRNHSHYTFLSNAYAKDYSRVSNRVSNRNIRFHLGGVRKQVFGLDKVWLTKHPLVFMNPHLRPAVTTHLCLGAHVADFSAVLYHFKFVSGFGSRVRRAVKDAMYASKSFEYSKYLEALHKNPQLSLRQKTARRLNGISDLVKNGFLTASRQYSAFARRI